MRKLQNFLKLFVPASLFQWEQFFLLGVPSFFLPHTPKVLIVAVPNLYDCVRNKDIIIIIIIIFLNCIEDLTYSVKLPVWPLLQLVCE